MNSNHLHLLPRLALIGTMVGGWMVGEARAQAVVPADPPPAGSHGVVPEKIEPPPPTPDGPASATPDADNGNSLGEDLSRTRGVIEPPPGMDPEIVQPPPDNGAAVTPVIPPSPDAQPK